MVEVPYGEARRLAYFRLICRTGERLLPCDVSFLADQILQESRKMSADLRKYRRTTGRMESKAVFRNYLRFCSWLELLKLEGPLVSRNSYTVFFSTITPGEGFKLSVEEKLAYFIHFWFRIEDLPRLLRMFSMSKAIKTSGLTSATLSEHYAETYAEWFVDLDLARPTRSNFGSFLLSPIGQSVVSGNGDPNRATCFFASSITGRPIKLDAEISLDYVWKEVISLSRELSNSIKSPVDRNLIAILPVLLHLQLRLIVFKGDFVPLEKLVTLVERTTRTHNASLTWDIAYRTGFLRLE